MLCLLYPLLHVDTLNATAFAPVKADINGNIEVDIANGHLTYALHFDESRLCC